MSKKCLRLIATANFLDSLLESFIQKQAKSLGLEGTAQLIDPTAKKIKITICGPSEILDEYIEVLHKGTKGFELLDLEIEPFLKDKDYRSVFRVIE